MFFLIYFPIYFPIFHYFPSLCFPCYCPIISFPYYVLFISLFVIFFFHCYFLFFLLFSCFLFMIWLFFPIISVWSSIFLVSSVDNSPSCAFGKASEEPHEEGGAQISNPIHWHDQTLLTPSKN
jgi:hypothetical protein